MKSHLIAPSRTRIALAGLAVAAIGGLVMLVLSLSLAKAAETTVLVPAESACTDTGIALVAGEKVTIEASGEINWGSGKATPVGKRFPQEPCGKNAYLGEPGFTEPGVNCYSMVFRIGTSGPAFPAAKKITFKAPV